MEKRRHGSGHHPVKDVAPGPASSSPQKFADLGGPLYFFTSGPQLWKSNASGTCGSRLAWKVAFGK